MVSMKLKQLKYIRKRKKIFLPKKYEIQAGWRKLYDKFWSSYSSTGNVRTIK
jgi:hypothetical protein